jgi:hypothetical protein
MSKCANNECQIRHLCENAKLSKNVLKREKFTWFVPKENECSNFIKNSDIKYPISQDKTHVQISQSEWEAKFDAKMYLIIKGAKKAISNGELVTKSYYTNWDLNKIAKFSRAFVEDYCFRYQINELPLSKI